MKFIIAVCDNMRKDMGLNIYVADHLNNYLGTFDSFPEYQLINHRLNKSNCLLTKGNQSVRFDCYLVSTEDLKHIDSRKGVTSMNETLNSEDYQRRIIIDTPFGKAYTYLANMLNIDIKNYLPIEIGNYKYYYQKKIKNTRIILTT